MDAFSTLNRIAQEQHVETSTAQAMLEAEKLLSEGVSAVEARLMDGLSDGPVPVKDISSYILDAGGKRIRPVLCMLVTRLFGGERMPLDLAVTCELLHNASLLHDDVIDDADQRRGKVAARKVWSNALSILGGDYILMRCLELVSPYEPPYMERFVGTLKQLVEGEIVQLGLRERVDATENDYFRIVEGKTASLFRFATETGALFAGQSGQVVRTMGDFGADIGIAFQLVDDVLDFSRNTSDSGKDLLADVSQGKMTLPVIRAAREREDVRDALCRLLTVPDRAPLATRISEMVRSSGVLDGVRTDARDLTRRAIAALDTVAAPTSDIKTVLAQLATSLVTRDA